MSLEHLLLNSKQDELQQRDSPLLYLHMTHTGQNYACVRAVKRWAQQHICCDSWFNRGTGPYKIGLFIHSCMQRIRTADSLGASNLLLIKILFDVKYVRWKRVSGSMSWFREIVSQWVSLFWCKQGLWSCLGLRTHGSGEVETGIKGLVQEVASKLSLPVPVIPQITSS